MLGTYFRDRAVRALTRLGPRGGVLLAWALVDIMYGAGLSAVDQKTKLSPSYAYPAEIISLQLWGLVWIAAAAILVVSAFRKKDYLGFTVAICIKLFWGLLMFGGWLSGEIPRGYVSMGIWVGAAATVGVCARYLPVQAAQDGD